MATYNLNFDYDEENKPTLYRLIKVGSGEISSKQHYDFFGVGKNESRITAENPVITFKKTNSVPLSTADEIYINTEKNCILRVYVPTVTLIFWNERKYKFSGSKSSYPQPVYIWVKCEKSDTSVGLVLSNKSLEFAPAALFYWKNNTETFLEDISVGNFSETFPNIFNFELPDILEERNDEIKECSCQLKIRAYLKDISTSLSFKNIISAEIEREASVNKFEMKTLFHSYETPCVEYSLDLENITDSTIKTIEKVCQKSKSILHYEISVNMKGE